MRARAEIRVVARELELPLGRPRALEKKLARLGPLLDHAYDAYVASKSGDNDGLHRVQALKGQIYKTKIALGLARNRDVLLETHAGVVKDFSLASIKERAKAQTLWFSSKFSFVPGPEEWDYARRSQRENTVSGLAKRLGVVWPDSPAPSKS